MHVVTLRLSLTLSRYSSCRLLGAIYVQEIVTENCITENTVKQVLMFYHLKTRRCVNTVPNDI